MELPHEREAAGSPLRTPCSRFLARFLRCSRLGRRADDGPAWRPLRADRQRPERHRQDAPPSNKARRWATAAASTRVLTPSLARMLETWTLAVFALMNSSSAI